MIKKAKTINTIYNEVKDYDLVITSDAPLRTALNKLVNRATLGVFAMTPKELSAKYAVKIFNRLLLSNSEAVLEVSKKLGVNIRQAHYHIRNIFDLWENLGSSQKVSEYIGKDGKNILDLLINMPIIHVAMEKFDKNSISSSNIAVVGMNLFTELDRAVLPERFTLIDVWMPEEEKYNLPNFFRFKSEKDLVDRLVDMVTKDNSNDIAIILNPQSSYLPLLRSRINNNGIPTIIQENLRDHFQTRNFLSLIEIGLNPSNFLVKDIALSNDILSVKTITQYYNYFFPEYLAEVNDRSLNEFQAFLASIADKSYREIIDWFEEKKIELPNELYETLYQLDLMNRKADIDSYTELSYYILNFDIEMKSSKKGVLFIDCNNSVYVNRPVCFYVGIDSSWDRDKEYINKEEQVKKDLDAFQILLQQGTLRYYLVNTIKNNQPVIPCYYFNMLYNRDIGTFADDPIFLSQEIRNKKHNVIEWDFIIGNVEAITMEPEYFSQSSLNKFYACPKQFMYSKLTYSEENEALLRGDILHDFAALYATHREIVEQKGYDYFADEMTKMSKKVTEEINLEIERSKYLIGIKNLCTFIGKLNTDKKASIENAVKTKGKDDNYFFKLFGLSAESSNTEVSFRDDDTFSVGKLDHIIPSGIIDYKTGKKKKSPSEILRELNIKLIKDKINFQPLMYILEMKYSDSNTTEFIYEYPLSNTKDIINGNTDIDIDNTTVHVKHYKMSFNEFLQTDYAMEMITSSNKERKKFIEKIGYDVFTDFFRENLIPLDLQFDKAKLLDSEYRQAFQKYILDSIGKQAKTAIENIEGILKTIFNIRIGSDIALIFDDDIEEFESLMREKYIEICSFVNDRFPYRPLNNRICKVCSFKDICLKQCYGDDIDESE